MLTTLRRRDTLIVLAFAAILHVALFIHDVALQFPAFLRGDRSPVRWSAVKALYATDLGHLVPTLAHAPTAPGEYIFGYALNFVGGPAAIVAFQIALFLLSLARLCQIAASLPWRWSVLVLGTAYTLLPHNLVFTHQFVTEAIATPFVVFFIYFYYRFIQECGLWDAILCGLALGIAIFVRTPLVLIIPTLLVVRVLYHRYFPENTWRKTAMICAVAMVPLVAWTAIFTMSTGRVGYTAGVANLGWNLRSKVFLVYSRNNLEQPEILKKYRDYPDLYNDSDGISVSEFAGFVSQHPLLFLQAAVSDGLIFFGRGDISKVFVDYLGDANAEKFKNWRSWISTGNITDFGGLAANAGALSIIFSEICVSVLTLACVLTALAFVVYCLLLPARVSSTIGPGNFALVLVLSSILIAVSAGAELVDQAQGRLRHPAEAAILLLLGMASWYFLGRLKSKTIKTTTSLDERAFAETYQFGTLSIR